MENELTSRQQLKINELKQKQKLEEILKNEKSMRDKIIRSETTFCECGMEVPKYRLYRHTLTFKHQVALEEKLKKELENNIN
jgi:hypothetical protein